MIAYSIKNRNLRYLIKNAVICLGTMHMIGHYKSIIKMEMVKFLFAHTVEIWAKFPAIILPKLKYSIKNTQPYNNPSNYLINSVTFSSWKVSQSQKYDLHSQFYMQKIYKNQCYLNGNKFS